MFSYKDQADHYMRSLEIALQEKDILENEAENLRARSSILMQENSRLNSDLDTLIAHLSNFEDSKSEKTKKINQSISRLLPQDKISPKDMISKEDIKLYRDHVRIMVRKPVLSHFRDTDSMDPVIDQSANGIEIMPVSESQVQPGDIVSYSSGEDILVHRAIRTGYDDDGWYAILKGDNEQLYNLNKVRFSQIKGILVAIIY